MNKQPEFPDTFLPDVARAADRAMHEVLGEDKLINEFLTEVPSGLRPRRPRRRT